MLILFPLRIPIRRTKLTSHSNIFETCLVHPFTDIVKGQQVDATRRDIDPDSLHCVTDRMEPLFEKEGTRTIKDASLIKIHVSQVRPAHSRQCQLVSVGHDGAIEIQFHDVCKCVLACDHSVQVIHSDIRRERENLVTGKDCMFVHSESVTDALDAATLWKVLHCLAQDAQHECPHLKWKGGDVLTPRVATSLHDKPSFRG